MLILGIYARSSPKSLYFTLLKLAIFILNLGFIFEISSLTFTPAFTAVQLQYSGGAFVAPLILLFACEYCGVKPETKKILPVFVIPVAALLLVLTWQSNGLFFKTAILLTNGVVPRVITTGSAYFVIFHVYNATLSLVAEGILVYHYIHADKVFRKQTLLIIIATALPVVCAVIILLLNRLGLIFDPTPVIFGATCLILGYAVLRGGLYRVAPIGREQIVETMHDAFIILDKQTCFLDANIAAKKVLPQLATASAGIRTEDIEGLSWICGGSDACVKEFSMPDADGVERHYKLSETQITAANKTIGRCIMFFDITETKKLLDEVSHLAGSDPLTGLINRRKFFSSGALLFGNLARSGDNSCMMMIDIDYFKKVNDNYGHPKGDEVLKAIAAIMTARFRSTDLIARYGGEEFCAYLPYICEKDAFDLANMIRVLSNDMEFRSEDTTFRVTVSIGLAICDHSLHLSLDMLLADADAALYEAKNTGRDKVVVATHEKGREV